MMKSHQSLNMAKDHRNHLNRKKKLNKKVMSMDNKFDQQRNTYNTNTNSNDKCKIVNNTTHNTTLDLITLKKNSSNQDNHNHRISNNNHDLELHL